VQCLLGIEPAAERQVCFQVLRWAPSCLREPMHEAFELDAVVLCPGGQLAGVPAHRYLWLGQVELGMGRGHPAYTGSNHAHRSTLRTAGV
jgi:hypothetical protein